MELTDLLFWYSDIALNQKIKMLCVVYESQEKLHKL